VEDISQVLVLHKDVARAQPEADCDKTVDRPSNDIRTSQSTLLVLYREVYALSANDTYLKKSQVTHSVKYIDPPAPPKFSVKKKSNKRVPECTLTLTHPGLHDQQPVKHATECGSIGDDHENTYSEIMRPLLFVLSRLQKHYEEKDGNPKRKTNIPLEVRGPLITLTPSGDLKFTGQSKAGDPPGIG
jgi:hypothetical protein